MYIKDDGNIIRNVPTIVVLNLVPHSTVNMLSKRKQFTPQMLYTRAYPEFARLVALICARFGYLASILAFFIFGDFRKHSVSNVENAILLRSQDGVKDIAGASGKGAISPAHG